MKDGVGQGAWRMIDRGSEPGERLTEEWGSELAGDHSSAIDLQPLAPIDLRP